MKDGRNFNPRLLLTFSFVPVKRDASFVSEVPTVN